MPEGASDVPAAVSRSTGFHEDFGDLGIERFEARDETWEQEQRERAALLTDDAWLERGERPCVNDDGSNQDTGNNTRNRQLNIESRS